MHINSFQHPTSLFQRSYSSYGLYKREVGLIPPLFACFLDFGLIDDRHRMKSIWMGSLDCHSVLRIGRTEETAVNRRVE